MANLPQIKNPEICVIIGAGPAGLTSATELQRHSDIKPILFEATEHIGGIAKTVNYKNNRIDIGGHRFFSKSEWVMDWWRKEFPIQGKPSPDYHQVGREIELSDDPNAPDPEKSDRVMLVRYRLSRIFFLRKFFKYPISLSIETILNLGPVKLLQIGTSYLWAKMFPIKTELSLRDFLINRFGKSLYLTFFKNYTEKVWGVPCESIQPEWGAQRIKGLSITKAITHALKNLFSFKKKTGIEQKDTETSLIERFLYPKYGPGQMWESVADRVKQQGGEIHMEQSVVGLIREDKKIRAVVVKKAEELTEIACDHVISTMPIKDLIAAMQPSPPTHVLEIASKLQYRDFITVGILIKKLAITNKSNIPTLRELIPDTWIYIQETEVKLGRLQIFNNWSPYMVENSDNVWLGLEYFCNEGDAIESLDDEKLKKLGAEELEAIGIISQEEILDSCVIRQPKAYPGYFGVYDSFDQVREFTDSIENLSLIGRNGMHRYNNQDHSMLTAREAVKLILSGSTDKSSIWDVNTEDTYHEENREKEKPS